MQCEPALVLECWLELELLVWPGLFPLFRFFHSDT